MPSCTRTGGLPHRRTGCPAAGPRVTEADFTAWKRQLATAGACAHPIRLRDKVTAVDLATGEARTAYDTATEPGAVLHVACGNRRETACSAVYRRDARQLVRSAGTGVIAGPCARMER